MSNYSADWPAITLSKKQAANWTCEECGLKCLAPNSKSNLSLSDRKKLELSVHHQNYNPLDNSPSNLIALCSRCHLGKHQRRRGNITPGQLTLNMDGCTAS
jgi:hypothetical protein